MSGRKLYIKVGDEEVKGPLDEDAVRASYESGVLDDDTLVGDHDDRLEPIRKVLFARKSSSRIPKLGLAVVGLLVAGGIATAIGLTIKNRPPPLCEGTPRILARLDPQKHVRIKLFVTSPGSKKLDEARSRVEGLLSRLEAESHGKLDYKVVEVKGDDEKKEAMEAGLQAVPFADVADTKAEASITSIFFGLVFTYGAEKDKIPILTVDTDTQTAEFFIGNKVREISAKADKRTQRIAVAIGHGGVQISDPNLVPPQGSVQSGPSIRGIVTQYFPYYALYDVDLKTAEVPKEAAGLLVTQPDTPYDDAELAKIDEHVMRGGTLAIVASAAHAEQGDARLRVKLDPRGLEKLTAGYGLELGRDVVYDTETRYRINVSTPTGPKEVTFDWIPVIKDGAGLDAKSALFIRLFESSFPLASSITIHDDKQPGARFRVLARTTNRGKRDTRESIELGLIAHPAREGEAGSFVVAASVEGTLTSAFGKGKSAKPARVLLIASSSFFANPFVRAGTTKEAIGDEMAMQLAGPYMQTFATSSILVTKNLLDWLAAEEDLGGCLPTITSEKKR